MFPLLPSDHIWTGAGAVLDEGQHVRATTAGESVSTENNSSSMIVAATIFLVLTYISVILRTYVRAVLIKSFRLDDWLMLVAQGIFTLSCCFLYVGVRDGMGRHDASLPLGRRIGALEFQALATATYLADMMFIKLSIAVFLLRFAVERRFSYTLLVSTAVVAVWGTTVFFWDLFQCDPVQAQWDFTIRGARCFSTQQVVQAAYSVSAMNIVTDWFYALLPIAMTWKVRMTRQAKATVMLIFGLGVFASVATIVRIKYLADLNDEADILWAGTDAMVWTFVEPGVAITASSLVTIRPLLRALKIKGFESGEGAARRGFPPPPPAAWAGGDRSGVGGGGGGVAQRRQLGRGREWTFGLSTLLASSFGMTGLRTDPGDDGNPAATGTRAGAENDADLEAEAGLGLGLGLGLGRAAGAPPGHDVRESRGDTDGVRPTVKPDLVSTSGPASNRRDPGPPADSAAGESSGSEIYVLQGVTVPASPSPQTPSSSSSPNHRDPTRAGALAAAIPDVTTHRMTM